MFLSRNLRAYIPETRLFCKGVVRYVDVSEDIEEIKAVAKSDVQIVDVQRITRRIINADGSVSRADTQSLIISFRG